MGYAIAAGAGPFDTGASLKQRHGIAMGIAVSLLLHLLLVFGYRLAVPKAPATPDLPQKTMTVWLRPAPQPKAAPLPEPPQKIVKIQPDQAAHPKIRKPAPAAEASPPAPQPSMPQSITLAPPASQPPDPLHPELQPKKFDMNAALQTARKVANEPDPARAGLPVAQLDKHPLYPERTETQLARDVAGAKRSDCKNTPGGLLAPLIWLMDKKDSGCKW